MISIKDGSEADAEDVSHDSNDSNSTVSCESSAEHSDSDDSSGMDEDECVRHINNLNEIAVDLEKQFDLLKEQLYKEKMALADAKLIEVRGGKSEEYLIPLQTLKEKMKTKMEVAGILKQYRLQNIRNKFLAEEQAALQNFESEKGLVYDSLHGELQEKIRKLEEDRSNVDIHTDLLLNSNSHRRKGQSDKKVAVPVSGPYIVYMLKDVEILEDWAMIKACVNIRQTKIL